MHTNWCAYHIRDLPKARQEMNITLRMAFGMLISIITFCAHAVLIVEIPLSSWSKPSGYYTSFSFNALYLTGPTSSGIVELPGTKIFDSIQITPSDSGRTFTLASVLDDPELEKFIGYLTNGQDNQLMFWYLTNGAGGPGQDQSESTALSSFLSIGQVDLSGYSIDSISLYVDTLNMNRVFGSPCNRFLGCTETSFNGSLIFNGHVNSIPEPSMFSLMCLGLLALLPLTRRLSGRSCRRAT